MMQMLDQIKSGIGGNKKDWHGVPMWGWYVGGGVLIAGSYILWKKRAAKATGSTATDANGNPISGPSAPLPGQSSIIPIIINTGGGSTATGPTTPVDGTTGGPTPTQPLPVVPPASLPVAPAGGAGPALFPETGPLLDISHPNTGVPFQWGTAGVVPAPTPVSSNVPVDAATPSWLRVLQARR